MNYIVRKAALHDIQPLINLRVTLLKEVDELHSQEEENGLKRIWLHPSKDGELLYKKMGFTYKENKMELFYKKIE
ncbi:MULTISPECIES: hypothetical protein [Bacillus]|uniref:GNAT family N-acetyltransferase n=1 Tax=Bacillus pseudomycoides TaxID=64104 RepID=A0A1Y3MFC9_9BACI|nr:MULTISPECIES: hypothetical protein [Bacillus cereus group]EOP61822.1 hypothetical protein IIW_05057 [Bacillus cereus VD136]EOQ17939.1 hypothetical protein KOY_04706 [Bacillus cereus VDM021]OOG90658.1 hypothetical protein BTH41_02646 [Bacillus mycoides]MDF2084238.1 hypothetical protein [Bacillus pseudomycoides]OUM47150.1 hypothetical protein BW425_19770 [Bacillus pseudomycoides]